MHNDRPALPKEALEGHERADLPIDAIVVDHAFNIDPRRAIDEEMVERLAANIKEIGLLEPLVVHAMYDANRRAWNFFLLAGFVRYAALKKLKWPVVPVVIKRELNETAALVANGAENAARKQVHPFYIARRFHLLHTKHAMSFKDIAKAHAYSESYVANLVSTYVRTNDDIKKNVFETLDVSEERIPTLAWLLSNAKKTSQEQQEAYEQKYGKERDKARLDAADHGAVEVVDKKPKRPYLRNRDDMLKMLQVHLHPDFPLEIVLKGFEADNKLTKRERVLCKAVLLWVLDRTKPSPFRAKATLTDERKDD